MARKRSRFINKERPSRFLPTKFRREQEERRARSVVRTSAYSPVPARSYDDDYLYVPFRPLYTPYGRYDSTGEENLSRSQINRELIMSSAAVEDNYDLSVRSRNRDRDVLALANRAITPPPTANESRGVGTLPRRSTLRRSQSAHSVRSHSVPAVRPNVSPYSTAILPLETSHLKASIPSKPSQYLRYSKAIDTAKSLREGTYSPMYSRSVRTSVSPVRDRSLSLLRTESPIRSPSPIGRESPDSNGRAVQRRRQPRVLANKRHVGNYYSRLLSRRESDRKDCKYWPYLDVDEIEYTDLGDLCSDTEDYNENSGDTTYFVQSNRDDEYDDGEISATPVRYVYEYESDIPDDYVPFRPKVRYRSPDKDYSKMSIIPYLPQRDPTKTSVNDTINFNAIVAESAARARQALERITWEDYDTAGLVLSVEGEYHSPENDMPLGFRYISRPLALKVAAADKVSAYDSDNSFSKYWTDLQKFREGIRQRLEDGYRALTESTRSYTPALTHYTPPASSSALSSYTSRPNRNSYYKRLRDDKDYKYGQSLELYPLESSKGTLERRKALPSSEDDIPKSRPLSVYDTNSDSDSRMSVLAKVKIKVDTELHSSPRSAVAARRVMRGHSTPPQSTAYSKTEVHVALARAQSNKLGYNVPPASARRQRPRSARVTINPRYRFTVPSRAKRVVQRYQKTRETTSEPDIEGLRRAPHSILAYLRDLELRIMNKRFRPKSSYVPYRSAYTKAALIGRKVDVVSPEKGYRRRPKSDYAKAKIRQLESDKRSMELSPVAVQSTTELKASRPSYTPKLIKPIHDVDGVKKQSNILSWQYKLDAITPPDDFIIVPRSLSSVKAQLRQAQDKMTKHRQLMDRYLNTDTGLTMDDQMVLMKMKNSVPNTRAASLNDVKPSDRERKRR